MDGDGVDGVDGVVREARAGYWRVGKRVGWQSGLRWSVFLLGEGRGAGGAKERTGMVAKECGTLGKGEGEGTSVQKAERKPYDAEPNVLDR